MSPKRIQVEQAAVTTRMATSLMWASLVVGLPFVAIDLWLGSTVQALCILGSVVLGLTIVPMLRATGSTELAGHQSGAALWIVVVTLSWTAGGGRDAPALTWLALVPVLALVVGGRRAGIVWTAIVLASHLAFAFATPPPSPLSAEQIGRLRTAAGLGLTFFLVVVGLASQTELTKLFHRVYAQLDELEEANRTKSLFLANMSHELRTPLNAILGYTEMIDELVEDRGGDPELSADLGRIHHASVHLLALINDLLDLSRIEMGHLAVAITDGSLDEQVAEVAQRLHALAVTSGTTLKLELQPVAASMDRVRALQVCTNLVHNAVKFAAGGTIVVRCYAEGSRAVVEVEDDGPGIPAADLERIFDEFQQVHPSARALQGGTGLGLAISRRLANAMGGALKVSSTVGRGSTFRLELPLAKTAPDPQTSPVASVGT